MPERHPTLAAVEAADLYAALTVVDVSMVLVVHVRALVPRRLMDGLVLLGEVPRD